MDFSGLTKEAISEDGASDDSSYSASGVVVCRRISCYTNSDGIIMTEAKVDNTINGSVFLTVVSDGEIEINATGYFNSLPLPPQ